MCSKVMFRERTFSCITSATQTLSMKDNHTILQTFEVFINNTKVTFRGIFVQKLHQEVSKSAKSKVASSGNRTHNTITKLEF